MAEKEPLWTIMLYLSGDNNLSSEMIDAINEIGALAMPKEGGNTPALTIQYDPVSSKFPPQRYAFKRREEAFEKRKVSGLAFPQEWARVPCTLPEDSAAPETLSDFIVWSVEENPSKYRMLVLSGHGSGAVGDFLPDSHPRLKQHVDRGRPGSDALTIPGLARALKLAETKLQRPGKLEPEEYLLHILGMDSCLMGMAEVAYQVQGFAEYLVASEGFVPNFGWPYGRLLAGYVRRGTEAQFQEERLTPELVGGYIVEDYLSHYSDQGSANVSVDIASCELAVLGHETTPKTTPTAIRKTIPAKDLRGSLHALTTVLCGYLDRDDPAFKADQLALVCDLVVLAHWRAQSFNHEEYTDLWDFCTELKKACDRHGRFKDIKDACEDVARWVEALVGGGDDKASRETRRQDYWGPDCQHAHGLAVYFPWSDPGKETLEHYRQLEMGRGLHHPGWARFLGFYVEETRREHRVPEESSKGDSAQAKPGLIVGRVPIGQGSGVRNSPGYNRNSPGYNRLLTLLDVPSTWSMKNPPVDWNPAEFIQRPAIRARALLDRPDPPKKQLGDPPVAGL